MMKYRVMYYYSVSPMEISQTDLEELVKMNKALDVFMAQDILTQFKISSFPYMKKDQKESLHRSMHKLANPDIWENQTRKLSLRDIASALGGANRG